MRNDVWRRTIVLVLVIGIAAALLISNYFASEKFTPEMYDYYVLKSHEETKVTNMVSAIYISYRVFDTLFEALLLAVAVTAVIYFAAPWDKKKEDESEG